MRLENQETAVVDSTFDAQSGKMTAKCRGLCMRNTSLYSVMQPILTIMKWTGLYHEHSFKEDKENTLTDEETGIVIKTAYKCMRVTPSAVYSAIICIILVLNTGRLFSMFNVNQIILSDFLSRILLVSWNINCTTNALSCFRASYKFDGLTSLFIEYDKFHVGMIPRICRIKVILITMLACGLVIANVIGSAYMLFWTNFMDGLTFPFDADTYEAYRIYAKIVVMLFGFYLACTWFLPTALMYILCIVLVDEFKAFNKWFKTQTLLNTNAMPISLERIRHRFESICKLVHHADEVLSIFIGVSLLLCSSQITINSYNLIWDDIYTSETNIFYLGLFWTITSAVQLLIICIGGAMVNKEAHKPLDCIYDICMDTLSEKDTLSFQVFLARLNGPPIGLSAMGMFVIDKPVIITMLGLILTYFLLIVEFTPNEGNSSSFCNCTEVLLNSTLQCVINDWQ